MPQIFIIIMISAEILTDHNHHKNLRSFLFRMNYNILLLR